MFGTWSRFRSAEGAEKKLPKPIYLGLAVIYLIIIILVGIGINVVGSRMFDASNEVLELYTK